MTSIIINFSAVQRIACLLLIVLSCNFIVGVGLNGSPIKKIEPVSSVSWNVLDSLVKNKRIVFLGEDSHGDGATLLAKNQTIQYLHENHGFDVLIIEQGFYETNRAFEDFLEGKDSLVGTMCWLTRIFPDCIESPDYELAKYLQRQVEIGDTIFLAGCDVPSFNMFSVAMYLELEHLLASLEHKEGSKLAQKAFITATNKGTKKYIDSKEIETNVFRASEFERVESAWHAVSDFLGRYVDAAKMDSHLKRIPFLIQAIESHLGYWDQKVHTPNVRHVKGDLTGDYYRIRDQYMAKNLLWLATQRYSNRKIIVSTSTYHMTRNVQEVESQTKFVSLGTRPMADLAWDAIGAESVGIAFICHHGRRGFVDSWQRDVEKAPKNSIEDWLEREGGYDRLVACDDNFDGRKMFPTFEKPIRANWSTIYDGIFFISKMQIVGLRCFGNRQFMQPPYQLGPEWYAPGEYKRMHAIPQQIPRNR